MAGSTIGSAPSGEKTTPDGTEKIPVSGSQFVQMLNFIGRKIYETGGATLSMGAVTDGQYLKRSGTSIISAAANDELRETSGPTTLSMGAVADGEYLKRDGSNIIGGTPAGGSGGGSGKNLLINGGMLIAQRGAGPFTSATLFPNNDDVYLLDGCILLSDGNDVADVSQVADANFVSGYKIRLDVETANKRFGILLPIENKDVQQVIYSGVASLQFKVKCTGTSMSNVRASLLAWDGTADTITSDVISAWGAAGANPTLAANWTAENTAANLSISTTIATKTIENIVVDTASLKNLAVLIIVDDTDATVGDFLEIGDIKLESGATCSSFEMNDYATELSRCRRYFESVTFASANNNIAGLADSTSIMVGFFSFKVSKRVAVHTFTVGTALSDFTIRYTGAGVSVVTAFTLANSGIESATHSITATGTPLTGGQAVQLRAANANAALYYSSEL